MMSEEMKMTIARSEVLMIEMIDFDSKSSDLLHRSSDLLHQMIELRGSLMIDSLIHMMNCCPSNVIFASMFDSMKPENNENLETTV